MKPFPFFSAFTGLLLAVGMLIPVSNPALYGQVTIAPSETEAAVGLKRTATSERSMVATVHPLATQAGLDALARQGNAIDAAVAAAVTLGVVDGFNSGIGGGCFILIRTADGSVYAIDGREMAPAAAHPDLYRNAKPDPLNSSQTGALASGVPGALAAFEAAVERHGKLDFASIMLPAAELAENGFPLTEGYQEKIHSVRQQLLQFPGSADIFFQAPDDSGQRIPYREGDILRQNDLGHTYRMIAEQGTDWFYRGPFAKTTARWMEQHGGIMTEQDFANYRTVDRKPIRTTYRDYEVVGFPPPSSGGVHVAQILNILENFDLKQLHQDDPAAMIHVIAEAMKFAFADRAEWLGDPDFVNVPRGLVDQGYADRIARQIRLDQVAEATFGQPPRNDTEFFERHTTHIAAADSDGNWVGITSTVNTTFGSKVIVPGLGVVMNNQMDDFVAIPDQPNAFGLVGGRRNAVEARKRPLSSMSPTILLYQGEPVLTVGAAGGPKIITEVVNAIIQHLDLNRPIDEAIAAPRVHHQWSPDKLVLESTFPNTIASELEKRGHVIQRSSAAGICQGISFDPASGQFRGAADPRTTGAAAGQ